MSVIIQYILSFLNLSTTRAHRLADVAPDRSRVRFGALSADRKMACVTSATVCTDVLEALHVTCDIALEVSLELKAFNDATDLILFLSGEVVGALILVDQIGRAHV